MAKNNLMVKIDNITLIQQMIDIKNAESNVKVTEILKSCNNLFKKITLIKIIASY